MTRTELLALAARVEAAVAATRQTGTWDAVADAVFAMERAAREVGDE
jgi:hypothetical protein